MVSEEEIWKYYNLLSIDQLYTHEELQVRYEREYGVEKESQLNPGVFCCCIHLVHRGYAIRRTKEGKGAFRKKRGGRRFLKPSSLEKTESDFEFGGGLCPA